MKKDEKSCFEWNENALMIKVVHNCVCFNHFLFAVSVVGYNDPSVQLAKKTAKLWEVSIFFPGFEGQFTNWFSESEFWPEFFYKLVSCPEKAHLSC